MKDHDPDSPSVIQAIEVNGAEFLLAPGRAAGAEERDDGRIRWTIANSPIDYHNCVVQADLKPEEADEEIEASLERMRAHGVPGSWHVGPSMRPSDLGERLIAHGFEYGGDDIGMAVDLSTLPEEVPTPADFVVERVRNEAGLGHGPRRSAQVSGRGPSKQSGPGRCTAGWVSATKGNGATTSGYWPVSLWRRPHPFSELESRGSTSCAPSNAPDGGGSGRESH